MRPCGTGGTALVQCWPRRSGNAVFIIYSLWRWHLDEVYVRINGKTHDLWRAVDHEGEVVEVFVTTRRDRRAALEFLTRAMKRGRPASIVTDRRPSYRAAMKVIGNEGCPETRRWLNNSGGTLTSTLSKAWKGQWLGSATSRPCRHSPPSMPRSTTIQPPTPSQSPRALKQGSSRRPGRVASNFQSDSP